jgi:hypothetical protein
MCFCMPQDTLDDLLVRAQLIQIRRDATPETGPSVALTDAVRQLRAGPVLRGSLEYESALEIDGQLGLSLFCPSSNRQDKLRETIFRMAIRLRPLRAKVSRFGRDWV